MNLKKNLGFTLIELTVVLLVLIALAGLAMPYVSGVGQKAFCDATDVSMQNIKKVIMERYYLDTLGYFPKDTRDAVANYNLTYLFTQPSGWGAFDPDSQTGWRGSYLQNGVVLNTATNLDNTFKDSASTPNHHVHVNMTDGDTVVLDAWGRPIIIQVTQTCSDWNITNPSSNCARLVSAGFGSGLGIGEAGIETLIAGNRPNGSDDRILYLNAPTPSSDVNPSCE